MRTDYHIHPDYSIDAEPFKIREYCERALQLELKEICFTPHMEFDPERKHMDSFVILHGKRHPADDLIWLDSFFQEIEAANREFNGKGLKIRAGIEIGYDIGLERGIERVVNTYPFDYVLGAIHCLDHIAISSSRESGSYFSSCNLCRVREQYFNTLSEAVRTGFFDCMAHIDLYTRYGARYFGDKIFTIHRGVIEPILAEMAERNMGLEINTSSLRRGLEEFHPAEEIISLAVQAGIRVFTVGSDAHRLWELGYHIDDALKLLDKFRVKNHVYENRKAIPVNETVRNYIGGEMM